MPAFSLPDLPSDLLGVAVRTVAVYLFLLLVLRLAGKREMGQLSVFDLVLVLVIANGVQNAMVGANTTVWGGVVAVLALILTDRALRFVADRSPRVLQDIEGEPTLLVRDGQVLPAAMRHEDVDEDELMRALREHGYLELSEIRQAILEVDGSISVIPQKGAESRSPGRVRRRRKPNQQRLL